MRRNGLVKEQSMCIAAVIVWVTDCWVRTFGSPHVWEMTCLYLPGTVSVSTRLSRPSLNTSCLALLTFYTQSVKSLEKLCNTAALSCDLLCLIHDAFKQRGRNVSTEVSGSICSWATKLVRACVADRRNLTCKVVSGIMPVSDSLFLALPFNAQCRGEKIPAAWGKVWPNESNCTFFNHSDQPFQMSCSQAEIFEVNTYNTFYI